MIIPKMPSNEPERLLALNDYDVLDTIPEEEFDDITRIASEICHTPISLVSIVDATRQWFKSHHGLAVSETPREYSFCGHAINTPDEVFMVPDSAKDERFHDNPLVKGEPKVAFYAGIPLVTAGGYALGTLCVLDNRPKTLTARQLKSLQSLARQIVCLLELRKKVVELSRKQRELTLAYADLERFSYIASHDLKSPLNNIISLAHLLKDEYGHKLDGDGVIYLDYINTSAGQLSDLVTGIFDYSRSSQLLTDKKEIVYITSLIEEVIGMVSVPSNIEFIYNKNNKYIYTSRIALKQILMNLCYNAIKYNDKADGIIEIIFFEINHFFAFEVIDNGPGIPLEDQKRIFDLFARLKRDEHDKEGLGIGLSVVKRLVEKLGGEITVRSEPGKGTSFMFRIESR